MIHIVPPEKKPLKLFSGKINKTSIYIVFGELSKNGTRENQ